jgi:hypothetical protein
MRLIISFFLTVIIYSFIILFLYFLLVKSPKKKEEVLIHTAISFETNKKRTIKQNIPKKEKKVKKEIKQVKKEIKKVKIGSKSSISKSGNVDFEDIFKNVKANVPTKPVNLKKSLDISRFKGLSRIEKQLKNLTNVNIDVTISSNNSLKEKKLNEIIDKIGKIWYEISNIAGEYAKINVISQNGQVKAFVIESNLDEEKQKELIEKIESLHFDKNFNLDILFQTKVSK